MIEDARARRARLEARRRDDGETRTRGSPRTSRVTPGTTPEGGMTVRRGTRSGTRVGTG